MSAVALPHIEAALLPPMIEPARTALVIVDIQIDFAAPEGLLGQSGPRPHGGGCGDQAMRTPRRRRSQGRCNGRA